MVATKKPLIVIVGETATGKSTLAIQLAKKFNGEIINADSWAVYKGFDIGTAKPNQAEQALIKHHLLDIADPAKGFSAAIFKRRANRVITDIHKRNKLPILSGGSGLYVDSILYEYSFLPASSAAERAKYNKMSLDKLRDVVGELGYDTSGIDVNNKRRLIRLLENKGLRPKSNPLRPNTLIIGISTDTLNHNIQKRVEQMFNAGLEDEVGRLSKQYGWDIEPMKGIGYREFRNYFMGTQNLEETKKEIIKDSLQLAKKQRTWFARNNSIQWVNNRSNVVTIVTTFLNKNSN